MRVNFFTKDTITTDVSAVSVIFFRVRPTVKALYLLNRNKQTSDFITVHRVFR